MKAHHCIVFLLFLPDFFFHSNAEAQSIRGDTIYVDVNKIVRVVFPSSPGKAELLDNDNQERLYELNNMGRNDLSIQALKEGTNTNYLEVTEGDRKHLFILSYKEGSPARSIDLSTKGKLKARIAIVKKNVANALNAADDLYKQAKNKNNTSDAALWKTLNDRYSGLAKVVVDPKDVNLVKLRLEEIGKQLQAIDIENKYRQALDEGNSYYVQKQYDKAKEAYLQALEYNPRDAQAKKWIRLNDSAWAKDFIDKGDAAVKVEKYVEAKTYYQKALDIMAGDQSADYSSLQEKFNQVKKDADPLIYNIEKGIGDDAWKANDIEEARKAYDSALSVRSGDKYIIAQLDKVKMEEQKIEQDEQKEAEYQGILATAKELADKASDAQGYDLAVKEYKRALVLIPGRKFPQKKIDELNKLKETARVH